MKIGLLLISTGKYHQFIEPLIDSARKYFMTNHDVTFFLFTDNKSSFDDHNDIVCIDKLHEPWPLPTLKRYETFVKSKNLLQDQDYLFYCDVDMLFVSEIKDEILSDRVATTHPGFLGKRGTPETNPKSLACVFPYEQMSYYAGGFNGGKTEEFLKMSEIISINIQKDLDNEIIAVWHDESHLNRYFIDNPPTLVLSPSYCYPENWNLPFEKKLLALDKNHKKIRA